MTKPKMKIYIIFDNYYDGHIQGINSAYLSKEKAQSVADELILEHYIMDIQDYMVNEKVSRKEATEFVDNNFPFWMYEVKEIEVEE